MSLDPMSPVHPARIEGNPVAMDPALEPNGCAFTISASLRLTRSSATFMLMADMWKKETVASTWGAAELVWLKADDHASLSDTRQTQTLRSQRYVPSASLVQVLYWEADGLNSGVGSSVSLWTISCATRPSTSRA